MSYQIAVRIEDSQQVQLQDLVDQGEFGNISEAVRYCIRMQLKAFKPRSPPPLVIEAGGGGGDHALLPVFYFGLMVFFFFLGFAVFFFATCQALPVLSSVHLL